MEAQDFEKDLLANIRSRAPEEVRDRFRGCLLGGAVGDALGAPVEFMPRTQILAAFGDQGIRDFVPAYGTFGAITDDTQMTLFTAEGVMRAHVRFALKGICHPPSVIAYAYLRWLHTQGVQHSSHDHCMNGWLLSVPQLHARRAPGNTCLAALQALASVTDRPRNYSKGCGGVMRVAPIGMWTEPDAAFRLACETAAITHGHPTGQLTAGMLAFVIAHLLKGEPLPSAITKGLKLVATKSDHAETLEAVEQACRLATARPADPDVIPRLGEGWIAEEALAICIYSALSASDFESGIVLAVNHGGDSDSTGSMTGNLLGAMHGVKAVPDRWLSKLELRKVIEEVADDLASMPQWQLSGGVHREELSYLWDRYPGA